ncbi:MAG: histidine ammonia-lyase [Desulfobacterales bacterium]|jgi:histidine ammonia-lyase|nr:histidine ammonia-lyase [Desulfobacterales bacterium]MDX2513112.1 histidine ammonia-lyase [Desulfobacterales bacterium]
MSITEIDISGKALTIEEVNAVANAKAAVKPLSQETISRMLATHQWLNQAIQKQDTVFYGINTGFGSHANETIHPDQAGILSRNVILADVAGIGNPLPEPIVRAMMVIRANTMAGGPSGIRPVVVETLMDMLNKGVTPFVPEKGSLGASGDLVPLAAIASVATCDADGGGYSGQAWYKNELMSGEEAMAKAGIARLKLVAKEGNSMINGTAFMAAVGCLAIERCEKLIRHAEIAAAISIEALLAVSAAFHPGLHQAANQMGQISVAENLRKLIQGSQLVDSTQRVQDAYCLRCFPQVLGPVKDTVAFARGYIERTLNAGIDNPLILDSQEEAPYVCISGGNFHGEGLAFMMDFLSIAMSEVASISDRRSFALLTPALNYGLPSMLIPANGLNTGLMVAQYAAAALVSDNKTLAHPDSVDSITTSADQEDHVSMGANGARHLWEILENVTHVIAIEFLCAAQAVDLREDGPMRLGQGTKIAHGFVRKNVVFYDKDREMSPDIARLAQLIKEGDLLEAMDNDEKS